MTHPKHRKRAIELTFQLAERRDQLIRLFGEDCYQERTGVARERIREVMLEQKTDNAIMAAISYCNFLTDLHPGEDVSTAQQFVLCAAADMAEER